MSILLLLTLSGGAMASEEFIKPETLFRQAAAAWQEAAQHSNANEWLPWYDFSGKLQNQFFADFATSAKNARLEIVGAIEEGILVIERASIEKERQRHASSMNHQEEDKLLSVLYATYGNFLMNMTPEECLGLALDPHTLLIGAERIKDDPAKQVPDAFLCRENAENHFRNAMTLDATNTKAEELFQTLIGGNGDGDIGGSIHERKPKEFVAELFDSFADTFDDKLLVNLEYRVPEIVGKLAQEILNQREGGGAGYYSAVLDAGCGTGLAGRYIQPLMTTTGEGGIIIGVDASQKMLDKAALCTLESGCGLPTEESLDDDTTRPLYDGLLNMDLEDMTVQNSLYDAIDDFNSDLLPNGFDLVVAADVLVYFGSLEKLLQVFAGISVESANLIFSCELATSEEAPLGWRLLPSGRFAHTKQHAIDMATKVGYQLIHYEEIVPRKEKGEPVRGHLFGFELKEGSSSNNNDGEL